MKNSLVFHDVTFSLVRRDNMVWLRSPQIADALGYKSGRQRIQQIYESHADEFTPSMTRLVQIKTNGGVQSVRVFSLRGAHLLAMFARTPVAKEFRVWALDILDREVSSAAIGKVVSLPEKPASDCLLPSHQAAEIMKRLDRLGTMFHPFSDQFLDVLGVIRALRGLNPKLGVAERGYVRVISLPQ